MTDRVAELELVERSEPFGRMRLALVDDDGSGSRVDACALTIDPLELHDGAGGLVRVGGIGNVETRPSHRRRGLASQLMELAIERMRALGYGASLLYGIDDFYDRFGYRSCGDERWVRVLMESIRSEWADRHEVRGMRDTDRDAIAALYERIAAALPGAASRLGGRAWSQLRASEVLVAVRDGVLHGWAWRGARDVPERDAVAGRQPGRLAYAEVQALDVTALLALLAGVASRERDDHPEAVELVTGACDGTALRAAARNGRFTGAIVDEVRPTGGAMLLEIDASSVRALGRGGELYQFLPDRF